MFALKFQPAPKMRNLPTQCQKGKPLGFGGRHSSAISQCTYYITRVFKTRRKSHRPLLTFPKRYKVILISVSTFCLILDKVKNCTTARWIIGAVPSRFLAQSRTKL